jgi:hypothetical protein
LTPIEVARTISKKDDLAVHPISWLHISDFHMRQSDSWSQDVVPPVTAPAITAYLNRGGIFGSKPRAIWSATAEKVGADTLLSQIVHMVSEAQRSRAPIQKLADTVAGYFVPTVILTSIIAFIVWAVWGPTPAMAYAIVRWLYVRFRLSTTDTPNNSDRGLTLRSKIQPAGIGLVGAFGSSGDTKGVKWCVLIKNLSIFGAVCRQRSDNQFVTFTRAREKQRCEVRPKFRDQKRCEV